MKHQSVTDVLRDMPTLKLNALRGGSTPKLAGTYLWVWGFLPKAGRDALVAAFDVKAVLWKMRFEASEAQWASFAEKVRKRKTKHQKGADDYYILGVSPAILSAVARQAVSQSEPVLPGGVNFREGSLELAGGERAEKKHEYKGDVLFHQTSNPRVRYTGGTAV